MINSSLTRGVSREVLSNNLTGNCAADKPDRTQNSQHKTNFQMVMLVSTPFQPSLNRVKNTDTKGQARRQGFVDPMGPNELVFGISTQASEAAALQTRLSASDHRRTTVFGASFAHNDRRSASKASLRNDGCYPRTSRLGLRRYCAEGSYRLQESLYPLSLG